LSVTVELGTESPLPAQRARRNPAGRLCRRGVHPKPPVQGQTSTVNGDTAVRLDVSSVRASASASTSRAPPSARSSTLQHGDLSWQQTGVTLTFTLPLNNTGNTILQPSATLDVSSWLGANTQLKSLAAANTAAMPVQWWTAVTVSKVLHRRRPHIVPLLDSLVYEFYGTKHPRPVRKALWEDIRENAGWLADLAATRTTPDGRPPSILRLADILIWTP
jgi:hypothetical protein